MNLERVLDIVVPSHTHPLIFPLSVTLAPSASSPGASKPVSKTSERSSGLSFLIIAAGILVLVASLIMGRTRLSRSSITGSDNIAPITLPASEIPAPSTFNDSLSLPKMMVFDLDYTLWPFWVDTHISGPLKPTRDGLTVKDRYGENCGFYNDVAGILYHIKAKGIILGAASRTCAPDLARSMLSLLRVPSEDQEEGAKAKTAISLFDHLEIYPGDKRTHFAKLQKKSGVAYDEMLFFDDESRNKNVESLGVSMQLVRDGVTRKEIDRGIEYWRERNGRKERERDD